MQNYFQGDSEHPQHVSVGAVLINNKNDICCHHFNSAKFDFKGYWREQGLDDFYTLMRKTIKPDETLENTLHRGLLEEFGAEAEIINYIGSIQSYFEDKGVKIQKTTLYFLCKLKTQDLNKRGLGDIESQIEWLAPDFLILKMKEQVRKYSRTDIDESTILGKFQTLI
jgi:hypothetical protein